MCIHVLTHIINYMCIDFNTNISACEPSLLMPPPPADPRWVAAARVALRADASTPIADWKLLVASDCKTEIGEPCDMEGELPDDI